MSIQSTNLQPQLVYQHTKEKSHDIKHFAANNLAITHNLAAWDEAFDLKHFATNNLAITHNLAARDKALDLKHIVANYLAITDNLAARDEAFDLKHFAANNLAITHNLAARDKALDLKHFAANNLTDNLNAPILACKPILACNLQCQDSRNHLIIARPLRELGAHVRSRKLPSLRLVARAIKALALSIFRWHLCDYLLIQVENSIFHNQKGRVEMRTCENLKKDYPYLIQCALKYECIPSLSLTKTQIETMKQINAQSLVELCKRRGDIALTSKEKGNRLSDLFKSKQLKLLAK